MKKKIEFKCPQCGGKAFYYPVSGQAGCLYHGWLLYTEIPHELKKNRKPRWNTFKVISKVLKG